LKELPEDHHDAGKSSTMATLLIIGVSGFALEAATIATESGDFDDVGFIANDAKMTGSSVNGIPVIGCDYDLPQLREKGHSRAFVAVGNPEPRRRLSLLMTSYGYTLATLTHPTAYLATGVVVGQGAVIYPHATIMSACRLGNGCLINANASLGHECSLGNYVNVSPGANVAGRVKIEDRAYIGIGAVILENRRIGEGAIVGGGSVVTHDVEAGQTVIGIPARPRV
jgi:sugar O-acyltransferase (sialic acid O-acetyltransferase NeuD family)